MGHQLTKCYCGRTHPQTSLLRISDLGLLFKKGASCFGHMMLARARLRLTYIPANWNNVVAQLHIEETHPQDITLNTHQAHTHAYSWWKTATSTKEEVYNYLECIGCFLFPDPQILGIDPNGADQSFQSNRSLILRSINVSEVVIVVIMGGIHHEDRAQAILQTWGQWIPRERLLKISDTRNDTLGTIKAPPTGGSYRPSQRKRHFGIIHAYEKKEKIIWAQCEVDMCCQWRYISNCSKPFTPPQHTGPFWVRMVS